MATLVPTFELAEKIGTTVDIDVKTVAELIAEGTRRWGPEFAAATKNVAIVVNGRAISTLKGGKTRLGPDDVVWLVKAAGGG